MQRIVPQPINNSTTQLLFAAQSAASISRTVIPRKALSRLGHRHRCAQSDTFGHNLTMKFPTVIYPDEDGMWIVECPAIPDCVSQGQTRDEAMENIKEAVALCLEVRVERGMPLTLETSDVEVAV